MPVTEQVPVVTHNGNGVTTVFAYNFKIIAAADLEVTVDDVVKTLTTHYSVSGVGSEGGGNVTMVMAPASGTANVVLRRDMAYNRSTDYQDNGDLLAVTADEDADRPIMMIQQLAADLLRTIKLPVGETVSRTIGPASERASQLIGFDENGDLILYVPATELASLNFLQSGTGALSRTYQNKLRDVVSVKDFGAGSAKTAAENLTAFKAAVAAVAAGGKLIVPVDSSFYSIDTSGGLTSVVEINKRMEIVIEGDVKANFGTMQANPPYIFNVTAAGVTFTGSGSLIGNGTIDDTNAGDITTFPGLIRVSGDDFTMMGVTIDSPPKVGVALVSCNKAKILGNKLMGGPAVYTPGNTAHFGVYASGGGYHTISNNHFVPAAGGGIFTNCIFFATTSYSRIEGNLVNGAWEKLGYVYGDYNLVIGNTYLAPAAGSNTDAYRISGSFNKLIGNIAKGAKGGCQIFDGAGNEVLGNSFIGCTQAGIIVDHSGGAYAGGFDYTKVIGNTVIGAGAGVKTDGIRVLVNGASSAYIEVSDNIVASMAGAGTEGLIRVMAITPYSISFANISDNTLASGINGVSLDRVVQSKIEGNVINGATGYGIREDGGSNNRFLYNQMRNCGNTAIANLAATSEGVGNQYTDAPLSGTATLDAAVTTTVAHGGVAANAKIFARSANTAAGLAIVAKGEVITVVSGTGFTITNPNGAAAAGTEQYIYRIDQ